MSNSVFSELRFWVTVVLSLGLPCGIYTWLLVRRTVSRGTVLWLGISLVAIAAFDVYFLSSLANAAKQTPSLADDGVFLSEVSLALYLLPAMFGGIGVNLLSHVLISHLTQAEKPLIG